MKTEISEELLDQYFELARTALDDVQDARILGDSDMVEDTVSLASSYVEDAAHFRSEDNYLLAYGALNFAHGLLDGLVRSEQVDVYNPDVFTQSS